MARKATARNVWIGNWMRAHGNSDMKGANAAYRAAHGGGAGTSNLVAVTGTGELFGPRPNPGGISVNTLALGGVVGYAIIPQFRTWINNLVSGIMKTVTPPTAGTL